ncbi:hypothetical protein C8J56DRAFT_1048455 [Mycena floridula]|nr:hypothetical protein C8J56DRAFT_1048455 [Mycena floridula]
MPRSKALTQLFYECIFNTRSGTATSFICRLWLLPSSPLSIPILHMQSFRLDAKLVSVTINPGIPFSLHSGRQSRRRALLTGPDSDSNPFSISLVLARNQAIVTDVDLGQDYLDALSTYRILNRDTARTDVPMLSSIPPSPHQSLIQTESGQANVLSGAGHDENNEPLEPCTHLNSPLNPFEMTTIATDIDDPRLVNERTLEQINSTMDVDDDLGFLMSPRTWKQVTAGDTSRSPTPSGDSSRSISPPPVINPHQNVTHTVDNSEPERRSVALAIFCYNIFHQRSTIPSKVSLFSNRINELKALAERHSVSLPDPDAEIEHIRTLLIEHLIKGRCFEVVTSAAPGSNVSLCQDMSRGYISPTAITKDFVNFIIKEQKTHPNFTGRNAETLVKAFYYPARSPRYALNRTLEGDVIDVLANEIETMNRTSLMRIICVHGIETTAVRVELLRDAIIDHLATGDCASVDISGDPNEKPACRERVMDFRKQEDFPNSPEYFKLHAIAQGLEKWEAEPLCRLLRSIGATAKPRAGLERLRAVLANYLKVQYKGKSCQHGHYTQAEVDEMSEKRTHWSQVVPQRLKDNKQLVDVPLSHVPSKLLKRLDLYDPPDLKSSEKWWDCELPPPPLSCADGPLKDLLLDHAGVMYDHDGVPYLALCKTCRNAYRRKDIPPLALSNRMSLGAVPPELQGLTSIEEAMIARCRAKCWIVMIK